MGLNATEKGQALVLITLAVVGLFAFTALAIDGSMVFSDHRHAQNAADTSVLAAALERAHGKDWDTVVVPAAKTSAANNGYNDNNTTNVVEVYICNDARATCTALPVGADSAEYIQVKITSHVKTYFARIVGWWELINHVDAVAHVIPGHRTTVFGGQALVALNKTACPAISYKGSSTTTITGSGVFVNSSCSTGSNQAFDASTGSGTFETPCMNVVGGVTLGTNTTLISPGTSCTNSKYNLSAQIQDPSSMYAKLNPCGTTAGTYNSTTLNPGNYTGAFPPGGQTTMNPGIYCIAAGTHSFSLQGGQTLSGSNVLIYMISGDVSWTSGGIHLSAMKNVNPNYDGLLLYLAPGNCSDVSITGNGASSYVGTILAPCSNVKLAGGSSTGNQNILENQIIADTITLTGSNTLNINFNATEQWQPPIPPTLQMTK
jgi:hypothetical protein